jgi:hypothetical protein
MIDFENLDKCVKNNVKKACQKSVENISFSNDLKEFVFSSIRKASFLKRCINKINLFAEYEINIPIKAYLVCALAFCIIFYYLFLQPLNVSTKDITAAKINYINISDLGGNNDTN